ncbi:isopenicillin-N N-acyltransferase-like protein [Caldalkalibacillus uzonensis]|uniref:Isopenicillin-N N-acyltransferase-like protein n=1 Tax=Caldalkalibacillus uzonensis TaxID=353224 RepID=A0ABU0CN14_9BACI|nr:C45 family peptidase [Caldalkalibacillus uzonensis]MDQ0337808.1 isopenicillin-N N-acyltransferase-like protein [Caldalkalibacillus uzonensis]
MIKRLELKGTPREIGEKHGREGAKQIQQSLQTYEKLFYGYHRISWQEARARALAHLAAIEKYDRQLLEEMEGVAIGAGVDFEDILALNARSEIALTGRKDLSFADGCTAVAVTPPAADQTLLGQNWDWKSSQKESLLLLHIKQEGKPDITMVTEGGIIGKIGCNSAGIGVCLNALITDKKSEQVPIHLGLRAVLNSWSLHEAIANIKGGQMASAANFLIAIDEGGGKTMAANIEVSPFGIEVITNPDGTLVHTNHICTPTLKQHLADLNEFKHEDSLIRKSRAEQLIRMTLTNKDRIDEECFKVWFSDLFNYPNSINHYANERAPEHRRTQTVFSIIMNLTKKRMLLCVGNPAIDRYKEVSQHDGN